MSNLNKLSCFTPTTQNEVKRLVLNCSAATCENDPLPTCLVKQHVDMLAPLITRIINKYLEKGCVPDDLKHANILPLIKKDNLDKDILKNYRPVSNLTFVSKLLEKVVAERLKNHLNKYDLWSTMQSAYRSFHSTETALLRVQNDLVNYIGKKNLAALVLLDLSAAFDTIDHDILLRRMSARFGITGTSLKWFESYLSNRSQCVQIENSTSAKKKLHFGVPQGSVLGPLLFTLYVSPIADITQQHNVGNMFYADDTQLYVSISPRDINNSPSLATLNSCLSAIKTWMGNNMLKLNDGKTELLLLGSPYFIKKNQVITIAVGDSYIESVSAVRNLGAFFDEHMSMDVFVHKKCATIQGQVRKLYRIRKYLTITARKSLIQALVISRLDYCCSLLLGTKKANIDHLQRLQNSAARFIFDIPQYESAKPYLQQLHWLPVQERIHFRILTYVFKCLNSQAPKYLSELLQIHQSSRDTRSSKEYRLNQLIIPNRFSEKAFSYMGPVLWNNLDNSIRNATSVDKFKKQLKTFLFKKVYNC